MFENGKIAVLKENEVDFAFFKVSLSLKSKGAKRSVKKVDSCFCEAVYGMSVTRFFLLFFVTREKHNCLAIHCPMKS